MKKYLVAGLLPLLVGSNAFAWMAMGSGDNNGTFIAFDAETPDAAREAAMKGCREHFTNCKVGKAVNGTAMVVAKGIGGWGQASDPDPLKASKQAVEQCRQVARDCKVTQAIWDPGTVWGAIALGDDASHLRVNAMSREDAEADALAGCRKSSPNPGSCQVASSMTGAYRAYYARAASKTRSGFGRATTEQEAKRLALENCNEGTAKDDACIVKSTLLNDTAAPEPKSMAQVRELAKRNLAQAPAKPQATPTSTSTTRSTNRLTCNNQCVNGDCIRTFPDGRKERWQAPRVYNPSTRNWEWDINTNACGA